MTQPIDMFALALTFHPDGAVRGAERRMTTDDGGWQVATFHVETDADVHADHWEVHPAAEEAVCCLSGGGLRMYFRPEEPGGEEEMTRLPAGSAVIVPRGRWHRIELDGPSDIMSITLRRGSLQEKR
ncbi:cupin [Actinomadura verrucosospora]|uniref:Cupin n=1 Tax=Actinomadura verrucosospora TaxID=46165 RepID=A0A7D3VRF7_ACTVE|nr:cupin [Actinomadura verrucosospora]QKG20610.1 cupin [Actinomadura verrucosospora]